MQSIDTVPTKSSISHAFRPFTMPIVGPARILPSAPQTAPADDSEARSAAVMLRVVSSISAVVDASSDSEASGVTARPMKRQPTVIHIQALRLCSPKRYQRLPLRVYGSTEGGSSALDSPGASGPGRRFSIPAQNAKDGGLTLAALRVFGEGTDGTRQSVGYQAKILQPFARFASHGNKTMVTFNENNGVTLTAAAAGRPPAAA